MVINLDLLNGWVPIASVTAALVVGVALFARPMVRDQGDDQGDGVTLVLLPPPRLTRWTQTLTFVLLFLLLNIGYHSVRGYDSPDNLYARALSRVTGHLVNAPAEINGYLFHFQLGLRALIVGTMISLAVAGRGTLARRLIVAAQIVWYLAIAFLGDVVLLAVGVVIGLPIGPATLLGNYLALLVGVIGMGRLLYANFTLPKPTAVPYAPRSRWEDAVILVASTVLGITTSLALITALYNAANPAWRPFLIVVGPLPFSFLTVIVRSLTLLLLQAVADTTPEVGDDRPPIDVLIPAYNESEVIVDTLRAIDRAAVRYGGPVNVILANDGSTDATKELALSTISQFAAATGEVHDVRHGGKSATLNAALAEAKADIVIRIDADTLIDDEALRYVPRWFRTDEYGLVEGLMWPRWRPRSPFPRMRLFEEARMFGINHRLLKVVNGINVVPGVFTAFRREEAVAMGGFTVGMNGEDGDFTLRMDRRGWRVAFDPAIVVREDVPPSFIEIREQRVRWSRATLHNQSRFGPYRAGIGSPMVWFSQTHLFYRRLRAPVYVLLPIYALVNAAFEGSWRAPFLVFASTWFVSEAVVSFINVVVVAGYGYSRRMGWVVLWPLWQIAANVFSTEALLSLPGRPVALLRRRTTTITEAVVH